MPPATKFAGTDGGDMTTEQQMESKNVLESEVLPRLDEAKHKLDELNQRVRGFVVEYPVVALGGAVLLGYLVARAAQRR